MIDTRSSNDELIGGREKIYDQMASYYVSLIGWQAVIAKVTQTEKKDDARIHSRLVLVLFPR